MWYSATPLYGSQCYLFSTVSSVGSGQCAGSGLGDMRKSTGSLNCFSVGGARVVGSKLCMYIPLHSPSVLSIKLYPREARYLNFLCPSLLTMPGPSRRGSDNLICSPLPQSVHGQKVPRLRIVGTQPSTLPRLLVHWKISPDPCVMERRTGWETHTWYDAGHAHFPGGLRVFATASPPTQRAYVPPR